ncbi:hypothetical protein [Rossellomorea aquimaris]|uniref:hypothetical protein n=1 Tax=Rossellomorea aquimaris TaxID=189382 RepID=UPI0007D07F64|nr:hypothetical protein [Rossellomorea aquimaris]
MLNEKILLELQRYIENNISLHIYEIQEQEKFHSEDIYSSELEEFINSRRQLTFSEILLKMIDEKGHSDTDIYKKARIDRRHFSKIRSNANYQIGKQKAIALALALELSKKEADYLLGSAGFSLSDSETFDLVIQFCIEKNIYDLDDVNQALDYFSLKTMF